MRNIGWHNFNDELTLFYSQLKQFLQEPAKELERMKTQALAMKKFVEEVMEDNANGAKDV